MSQESDALEGLVKAAASTDASHRGTGLLRLAADFAQRPERIGAQTWLWLGTTQLALGSPRSASACLQQAASAAMTTGSFRIQRSALIDLVHAFEQAGSPEEALAAHKELRRLEAVIRDGTEPCTVKAPQREAWTGPDPGNVRNPHLRRALRLLASTVDQFNVDSLARACDVSRRTLEKTFRAELGLSVAECLRERRLALVRTRLTAGGDSIKKIALESGYPSASALCHDFKRATGQTPAGYRARTSSGADEAG